MHVRRESNPQPAVLETAALPIELLTYKLFALFAGGETAAQLNKLLSCVMKSKFQSALKNLFGFFMRCPLLAPRAVLFVLNPTGLLFLILCCRIIAPLTFCTL
jgi:hypothetical protein